MKTVYLNGKFVPIENAHISILDRGLLFGDSVYEAMPVFQGYIFGLKEHLERLHQSLSALHMVSPLTDPEWENVLYQLLSENAQQDQDLSIYLQVTRGSELIRNHAFSTALSANVFALCQPAKSLPYETLVQGLSAITVDDHRRFDCSSKTVNLLPNIMAYQKAHDNGCEEAIFIRNGLAVEGTSSNLFIVKNNQLITPPLNPNVLPGVTRGFILELAKNNGINYSEEEIPVSALENADEIWLTGSLKEIFPIIRLNGKMIGSGKVGTLWHTVTRLYQDLKISARKNYFDQKVQSGNTQQDPTPC